MFVIEFVQEPMMIGMISFEGNETRNRLCKVGNGSQNFVPFDPRGTQIVTQFMIAQTKPMREESTHTVGGNKVSRPTQMMCRIDRQGDLCERNGQHGGQQSNVRTVQLFDLRIFAQDFALSGQVHLFQLDRCKGCWGSWWGGGGCD